MIRLISALCGALVAFMGADVHSPVSVLLGLLACAPAAIAVARWQPPQWMATVLGSAVLVGMVLAAVVAGHHGAAAIHPVACAVPAH